MYLKTFLKILLTQSLHKPDWFQTLCVGKNNFKFFSLVSPLTCQDYEYVPAPCLVYVGAENEAQISVHAGQALSRQSYTPSPGVYS